MCQIGDIIVINKYKHEGVELARHSFVVIDDENGIIQGLPYDFVANVLSSFKGDKQRKRKLSYPGTFPISHNDTDTEPDDGRDGFVKADQLYYFSKKNIDYRVIGEMKADKFNELIAFIENSDFLLLDIVDNL
nr:MAG TPA: endoribonuclease [Caudoviricetes sp.]DAU04518.1 MAG TPA: endoribonuclease [Caudoviricetes sp.]